MLYSADTGPEWSLEALGHDADLAVCEATLARRERGHRTAPVRATSGHLGEGRARAAAGGHPLLADLDPRRHEDEAAEAFGRRVGVAVPGKTFTA